MNDPTAVLDTPKPDFYKPFELMTHVESRFAAIPGQPSLIYCSQDLQTVVSICPTPQVGLVSAMPNTLNYVTTCHQNGDTLTQDKAAELMEYAANKLSLDALMEASSDETLPDEVSYQVAIDPTPVKSEAGIGYRAVLCVPCTEDIYWKNVNLALHQGFAAKRLADLHNQEAGSTTKH